MPNKPIILFIIPTILLLLINPASAQNFILPGGEYMDTTTSKNENCPQQLAYYYSVGGKYPESSTSLLKKVQIYLQQRQQAYSNSGYITFRFVIDCEGNRMPQTEVLQTDENYMAFHFERGLVNALFDFLKILDKWKAYISVEGTAYAYKGFLTFKIKNGKVINIIP